MYSDKQNRGKTAEVKISERGQTILISYAVARIVFAVVAFFLNVNVFVLILSIAISIALANGVNWVRWFCVVGGIIANTLVFALFPALYGAPIPVFLMMLAIVLITADFAMLIVLAVNKSVNAFIQSKELSKQDRYNSRNYKPKRA